MTDLNIVALGDLASSVSTGFGQYPQYKIYSIVVGNNNDNDSVRHISFENSVEEYERNTPNFGAFFSDIRGEVLVVCTGSEAISGSSLRIIEQLKGEKVSCMFLRSERGLLTETEFLQERVAFNVLQQYARSGMIERMFLVDIPLIDDISGDVSIMEYSTKQAEIIASTYHMVQVFMNSVPVMGHVTAPQVPNRISTIGITSIDDKEDKMFFSIDKPSEKYYLYAINKGMLNSDKHLLGKIRAQVRSRSDGAAEVKFGIFPTEYEDNFVFCLFNTKQIQGEEKS